MSISIPQTAGNKTMSHVTPTPLAVVVLMMGVSIESGAQSRMPPGFVDVSEVIPTIAIDLRYVGNNNFVGTPVDGYVASRCIMTSKAATALKRVQEELAAYDLGLKIFDAYRPQQAVDHFVRWSHDEEDQRTKGEFYPHVAKSRLFQEGYIAARSSHSRGSTVDLTLVSIGEHRADQELDMGTPFDYFGRQSWISSKAVSAQQRANRLLLRSLMTKQGFRPYDKEWWHFTLVDEPFPDTYFNFRVE